MNGQGKFEAVIGLEVHAQMLTASKAFCGCSTAFGSEPNTNVCPVCLGMPGTLPVLNRSLVEYVLRMGLATGCTVPPRSVFARKNYFYPDLPKGYQISQYEEPICINGCIEIAGQDGSRTRVGITRIHMEEDAGKLIHDRDAGTLVDANRCGVPLIEIVSEPDLRTPGEAYAYLTVIRQLLTYLGICDGNMEEGSLRCDANVSVRPAGERRLGTKTEVKNMNSFRNVERALAFEIDRQIRLIGDGGRVVQETLLWDADQGAAYAMRSKEEAHDYRYFPDPDLVPIVVDEGWIARVRASLPELPPARRERFVRELGLPPYDAELLTSEKRIADYFEEVVAALSRQGGKGAAEDAKAASNWVMTDVLRVVNESRDGGFPFSPEHLSGLIGMIQDGTVSVTAARKAFDLLRETPGDPRAIVERHGLGQVSDAGAIGQAVDEVLTTHAAQVLQFRGGNRKVFGFLVGETMRRMNGKGNPKIINDVLRERLGGAPG